VASWQRGDHARAESLFAAALTSLGQIVEGRAEVLASMGFMAVERDQTAPAEQAFTESLYTAHSGGLHWLVATDLEGLAGVAAATGKPERAGRFLGAAQAIRTACGTPLQPMLAARYEQLVAAVCAALGDERYQAAFAQGQAMTLEQVIGEALGGPASSFGQAQGGRAWRGFHGW
jgi:hypothetical protein